MTACTSRRHSITKRMTLTTLTALLLVGAAGCSRVPAPGASKPASDESARSAAVSASAPAPAVDPAATRALALIVGAEGYEESMKARVITDVKDRLQYDRAANITVVVRIDRDGAPVDLHFLKRTGDLRAVAFGTPEGKLRVGYDKFAVATGKNALALVDQLAAKLPAQP